MFDQGKSQRCELQQLFMRPKLVCKFGLTCRNFVAGRPCNFSHDAVPEQSSKFDKPIGEVLCKYGVACKKKQEGKCPFKHPNSDASQQQGLNKKDMPCKYGDRCTLYPLGKCHFKHEAPPALAPPVQPRREEKDMGALESLCLAFLTNKPCNQSCSKFHGHSQTKTITKTFTVSNCSREIRKIMIMQAYSPDEQPLFIILGEQRVIFCQLTNLAKETGNQNLSNSSLVLKRCFEQDIVFADYHIQDAWLVKAQSPRKERADILVIKCPGRVRLVVFNKAHMDDFAFPEEIQDAAMVAQVLVILTKSRQLLGFEYNFGNSQFRELGVVLNEPLLFLKKYHKTIQEEEIAAGATQEGSLCFINGKLKTHKLELKENIRDVCMAEYQNIPAALVLLEKGTIIAVNLLTFETTLLLEGNLPRELRCSSLTLTLQHLIMAIDGFGVIVYNYQQFNKIIGVLALGPYRWTVSCNQRGNVAVLSEDNLGNRQANLFRFLRL